MGIPQNTKNRAILWPSNSIPGYISEKNENANSKRYMHPYVHSSTIHNTQDMEATYMLTDEWIKKMWDFIYLYTHPHIHTVEYYSTTKKNEILPFATTWMDLEGIMLSEISQRKTYTVWYHI